MREMHEQTLQKANGCIKVQQMSPNDNTFLRQGHANVFVLYCVHAVYLFTVLMTQDLQEFVLELKE